MSDLGVKGTDYGNWVSKRIVYMPAVLGIVLLVLAYFVPILAVVAVLFLLLAAYFVYARYLFSPAGGDVQRQVRQLALDHLDWDGKGKVLDVGCGSGALVVMLAKKYPQAAVTGVDYWGKQWEYSKGVCERNAEVEGVRERVEFQQASASSLPFDNGSFDAVVSNLTFHEVRDTKDKKELIRESLRVLKKGGKFSFQDLFLIKAAYGNLDELLAAIRSWGVTRVEFVETRDSDFIPSALKLPFMVGTMGIISGEK